MSQDSEYHQPPVQKKKKGGCLMAALIVGAIVIFGIVGIAIAATYWAKDNLATDPAKAAAVASEFADVSEWEGWQTQAAMNMFFMRMAVMNSPETGGMAWFMNAKSEVIDDPSARAQVEARFSQQNSAGEQFEKMKETSSRTENFTVREQETEFTIREGEGESSGKTLYEVTGVFPGKTADRSTMLWLRVPAEQYPIEKIKEMIGQIR